MTPRIEVYVPLVYVIIAFLLVTVVGSVGNRLYHKRQLIQPALDFEGSPDAPSWTRIDDPSWFERLRPETGCVLEAEVGGRTVRRTLAFAKKPAEDEEMKYYSALKVWTLEVPLADGVLDETFSIVPLEVNGYWLEPDDVDAPFVEAPVGSELAARGEAARYRRLAAAEPYIVELVEQLGRSHFSIEIDSDSIQTALQLEYLEEEDIAISVRMMVELAELMEETHRRGPQW